MRMDKGKPFMDVEADDESAPTFSEAFLYERVGKGDARFILGVAEEYEHIISALGPTAIKAILQVKPKLVQRLGVGAHVTESLEDARDEMDLYREQRSPSQVILDEKAAHDVWQELHYEYQQLFNPEKDMDRGKLRAYHALTDGLGEWEQKQRSEEQERLPEKLKKQEERRATIAARKEARAQRKKLVERIVKNYEGVADLPAVKAAGTKELKELVNDARRLAEEVASD